MRLLFQLFFLAASSFSVVAQPPEDVPLSVRDLPLEQIRQWTGNVVDWPYANYSAGRGIGTATLDCPSPIKVARTVPRRAVTVKAGRGGIAPGGTISVLFPLGSVPPQTDCFWCPSFVMATQGYRWLPIKLENTWLFRQETKFAGSMQRVMAKIALPRGLNENKTVKITRYRAYPGIFARGWESSRHSFRVYVDHDADGWEEEIAESPWIPKLPAQADRLLIRARSTAVVGESVRVVVSALDRYGNPAYGYRGVVTFAHQGGEKGMPGRYAFTESDAGAHTFDARFERSGYYWITVRDEQGGLVAESNPIEVLDQEPAYRLYWGDLHVHTERSADVWNSSPAAVSYGASYDIGRYRYALDFMANTDHHDFQVGNYAYEDWLRMIEISNEANAPGKFVTLVAAEVSHGRGDQNIYVPGDNLPFLHRGRRYPKDLWRQLRSFESFAVPHHFAQSMRPWNWKNYDAALMPIAEIFSLHGRAEFFGNEPHYSNHATPTLAGYTWQDQLAKGRRIGAIAASDDHKAQPGSSGLAGVWATKLSRDAIYDNLKNRHSYASTNARAILHFAVNGVEMGGEVVTDGPPQLRAYGATPAEILEFHIVKNNEVVFEGAGGGRVFDVTWQDDNFDGDDYYYIRIKMAGDEKAGKFLLGKPEFVWSSPVWVTGNHGHVKSASEAQSS